MLTIVPSGRVAAKQFGERLTADVVEDDVDTGVVGDRDDHLAQRSIRRVDHVIGSGAQHGVDLRRRCRRGDHRRCAERLRELHADEARRPTTRR